MTRTDPTAPVLLAANTIPSFYPGPGSRLPLHLHPDQTFAGENLGSPDALLAQTNRVPVRAGDVLLCPACVPHAIGAGVLVIELQEATDSSSMLEWDGFPLDPADAFLGLEPAAALAATERTGYGTGRLLELFGRRVQPLAAAAAGTQPLLPPAAAEFFGADQVRPAPQGATLDAGFSVLVVLEGDGLLSGAGSHPATVRPGQTWLIPFPAGPTLLTGDVTAIRCHAA